MSPVIFPEEVDRKIVFLGLGGSGKTTLVRRLRYGDNFDRNVSTTMGVAIELLELKEGEKTIQYLALDCGGQVEFARAIWQPHVEVADGVVFLFDSTRMDSVEEAQRWLQEVLSWIKAGVNKGDTPLLFLANKSDLENAKHLDEIVRTLQLDKFIGKSFGVYQISAIEGTNVEEAFKWFFQRIIRDIPQQE